MYVSEFSHHILNILYIPLPHPHNYFYMKREKRLSQIVINLDICILFIYLMLI